MENRSRASRPISLSKRAVAFFAASLFAVGISIGTMASAQAAILVGVCTLKLGEAHASTHVSGTINALSSVNCTLGMPSIYIRTTLIKNNGPTWQGNVASGLNVPPKKVLSSNKGVTCAMGPGSYRSSTYVQLNAPSNVQPVYHENTYFTIWRSLACGVSKRSASTETETHVDISVMSDGRVEFAEPEVVPVK